MSYQYEHLQGLYEPAYENISNQIEDLRDELNITNLPLISTIQDDTYDNVSIEGNQMNRKEVTYLLENDVTIRGKSIRDHLQAKNCYSSLDVLKTMVMQHNIKITPDVIQTIHYFVTLGELKQNECGQYRQEPVHIKYTDYIPPHEWEIEGYVKELCSKLYEPLNCISMFERICEFKRNFERIHPFIDGNGRTGRVLMNLLFLQHGYSYISIPAEERDQYFESLDNNTFHLFVAQKMLNALQKIKEQKAQANEIMEREDF